MEEKKQTKISLGALIAIIVIVLILVVGAGYLIVNKVNNEKQLANEVIEIKGSNGTKLNKEELKEYLGAFALMNYYRTEEEIKEPNIMTVLQLPSNKVKDIWENKERNYENAKIRLNKSELEKVINAAYSFAEEYKLEEDEYSRINGKYFEISEEPFNDPFYGKCLEIKNVSYENGIYTIDFIYEIIDDYGYPDVDNFEDYEAIIKIKLNENTEYSKYKMVSLSKGTPVVDNEKRETKELEDYLSIFSVLNREGYPENENVIWIAEHLVNGEDYINKNKQEQIDIINDVVKEFYYKDVEKENGVIKTIAREYSEMVKDDEIEGYGTLSSAEVTGGKCLGIIGNVYDKEKGIYTIKYIYEMIEAGGPEAVYEATVQLKINENSKYSKYKLLSLTKGTPFVYIEDLKNKLLEAYYYFDEPNTYSGDSKHPINMEEKIVGRNDNFNTAIVFYASTQFKTYNEMINYLSGIMTEELINKKATIDKRYYIEKDNKLYCEDLGKGGITQIENCIIENIESIINNKIIATGSIWISDGPDYASDLIDVQLTFEKKGTEWIITEYK